MPINEFDVYPDTTGMSYRERKILLLQEQQGLLRESTSTKEFLQFQQDILREALLGKKPKSRKQKIARLQKSGREKKSLEKKEIARRMKEERLRERFGKDKDKTKIKGRMIKNGAGRGFPY